MLQQALVTVLRAGACDQYYGGKGPLPEGMVRLAASVTPAALLT